MNIKSEGKIGRREQVSIMLLCIGIKLADTTPSLLYGETKSASWMVPFVSLIIFLPFFWIAANVIKKYEDKNLIEVTYLVFGKFIGFIFSVLLFAMGYLSLIIDVRDYVDTIAVLYFPETPLFYLILIFLLGCFYNARKGLETIGSAFYICVPYIKISLLILGFFMLYYAEWNRMFPLLGGGVVPIMKEGLSKSSIYGDVFFFLAIYPNLVKKESFNKLATLTGVVLAFEIGIYILLYILLFQYPFVERITYPFHEAAKYIQLGKFATHVETYFLIFWLLTAILRFSFYIYSSSVIFSSTFKIKDNNPVTVPLTTILLTLTLVVDNSARNTFHIRENAYMVISIGLITFSILLWIVHKLKGLKKAHDKVPNN